MVTTTEITIAMQIANKNSRNNSKKMTIYSKTRNKNILLLSLSLSHPLQITNNRITMSLPTTNSNNNDKLKGQAVTTNEQQ